MYQTGQNNVVNFSQHEQLLHMMPLNTWKPDSTMPSEAMNTWVGRLSVRRGRGEGSGSVRGFVL